jgi:hypothetical protein
MIVSSWPLHRVHPKRVAKRSPAFRYVRVGQGHCRLFSPNVEPNADGGAGCGRGSKQHIGIASKKYKIQSRLTRRVVLVLY